MSKLLAPFIRYLEENKLVKFDVLGDTEECFENRLRIQKCGFLAKRFGLDFPYKHGIYLYGPFSSSMSGDFYEIAENRREKYDGIDSTLPESFKSGDFLKLVNGKSADWLEIAATIVVRNREHTKRDELVKDVERIKHVFSKEFISGVLDDLDGAGLVKVVP